MPFTNSITTSSAVKLDQVGKYNNVSTARAQQYRNMGFNCDYNCD